MHGQFTWYELHTPDPDGAIRFYPRFTGWGTQRFDDDYTMWTVGGEPFAGIFRLTPEQRAQGIPPNWMAYVASDDVDATARQATALGGQVLHGPGDVPGAGRFAVVQDPQGAVFGVYKSATSPGGWDGTPVIGRFSWHELMTTDYVKAGEFYRQLFGWENQGEMDMGGGVMYRLFGKDGKMYGGMYNKLPGMEGMRPFWLYYICVKDVAKAVDAATKGGAMVQRPQMDIPGGSIAILGDPQGAGFAVHHIAAPAEAQPAVRAKAAAKKALKTAKRAVKKLAKRAAKAIARVKPKARPKAKQRAKAATRPKARVSAAAKRRTAARPGAAAKRKAGPRAAAKTTRTRPTRAKKAARAKPGRAKGGARAQAARRKALSARARGGRKSPARKR